MDDKEFEEIKKDWTDDRIAYLTMQLLQTRPVSIIQQLIAYCEELREINKEVEHEISFIEDLNTKLLEANAGWREENEKLKDELNEAGLNW